MSSQSTLNSSSRHTKTSPKNLLHVLSISAAVTRLRWRPPAGDTLVLDDEDRHEAMLAVSTAPIKGASAGGSGLLALWSYHRPFMPLSVVEGHKDGAVTDFDWLDTPQPVQLVQATETANGGGSPHKHSISLDARQFRRQGSSHEVDAILYDNSEQDGGVDRPAGIWQHTISVGRDGRCLMQSFARGAFELRLPHNYSSMLYTPSVTHFCMPLFHLILSRRASNTSGSTILLRDGKSLTISEGVRVAAGLFCLSTCSFRSPEQLSSHRFAKR
jgi:hypothetical protein